MKTYIPLAVAVLLSALAAALYARQSRPAAPAGDDKDGHVLSDKWSEYEKAHAADRPQKMMSILDEIKREAVRRHLPVDFYDAASRRVEVGRQVNWKQYDSLKTALEAEVKAFDEPIVTFIWGEDYGGKGYSSQLDLVKSQATRLQKGRTTHLWSNYSGCVSGYQHFVTNDYEFALWRLLYKGYFSGDAPESNESYRLLKDYFKDSYPGAARLAYVTAGHRSLKENKLKDMRSLAEQYKGKAFSLFPREDLLEHKFDSLGKAKADEAAYKALDAECKAYLKEKNGYTGDEKKLVEPLSGVQDLSETLHAERIGMTVRNDTALLYYRNVAKSVLVLRERKADGSDGKELRRWNVVNKSNRFYKVDREKVVLPRLNDGRYRLEMTAGKLSSTYDYTSYTVSLAVRKDADATRFYATDYITGKPFEAVKLMLYKGSDLVKEATVTQRGFTPLPESLAKEIKKYTYYYLRAAYTDASGRIRLSEDVSLYTGSSSYGDDKFSDNIFCNIYKDRGAYNPDDVMKFKAVLFRGDLRSAVRVIPEGETVEASLKNASGKVIDTRQLKTTAFGSVSGEFVLERGEKNGYYELELKYKNKMVGSDSFRVDDFVLPTFTVDVDRVDELVTAGDSVCVKGKVESFSGHSLTAAKVKAKITRYGTTVKELETAPAADGSFTLEFVPNSSGFYFVEVTVTDATGETAQTSTGVCVVSSFSVSARVVNRADATSVLIDESNALPRNYWRPVPVRGSTVIFDDTAEISFAATNSDGERIPMEIHYELIADKDGAILREGTVPSGENLTFDLSDRPSGLFRIKLHASAKAHDGDVMNANGETRFLLVRPSDKKLDAPVRRVFIPGKSLVEAGETISVRFGSNDGPVWAVATVYGLNATVLETKLVNLSGGDITDVAFAYKTSWPDAVRLKIFYFKYGDQIQYERVFRKVRHSLDMPLSFSSFTDRTAPATEYTFSVQARPGVEAVAAVYDKSLDAIARNYWNVVRASDLNVSSVSVNASNGAVSGSDPYRFSPGYVAPEDDPDDFPVLRDYVLYETTSMRSVKSKGAALGGAVNMMVAEAPVMREAAVAEDAAMMDEAEDVTAEEASAAAEVSLREVFADALTFQPHLLSDDSGKVTFTFKTSDKLSTYYVAVYAHDKDMRNGYTVQEMQVSVPVKVALVEPGYLYETDRYTLGVTVSSNQPDTVKGKLMLFVYPGKDHQHLEPVSALRKDLTVPAGSSVSETFAIAPPAGAEDLGVKVVFVAEADGAEFSDAVFVPIEVKKAEQTLTEAHSAVWLHGADKEALKADLRSRFVNVDASEAAYSEITILDMVKEALPSKYEPQGKDVVSLSEAYYVQLISEALRTGVKALPAGSGELLGKILACRNGDGGFGWFEGMKSSRVLTAVLLERFALLRDRGFEVPDLSSSVKYLDDGQFTDEYPLWCGWLGDWQYLYIRSMYTDVPFSWEPEAKKAKERWSEFKKATKAYLVPGKKDGRGLQGYILGKARRIKTLRNLTASEQGIALAKKFGVRLSARQRMDKSMVADLLSLVEYAVKHPHGGYYYPNAVMPYRGLMESEAYAHSLLCDLLTSVGRDKNAAIRSETGRDAISIADGIRLWLMLQKETQKWGEDPAFVNAISSVLDGSEEVLATQVLIYKATYTKPFKEIAAAGNGFTVARKFYREESESKKLEPIAPGTVLSRGDRIVIRYEIWNQENRSFVKLTAPREASLRPVNQLSGHIGWWLRPLSYGNYSFTPQGYRNVLTDRTEYYFDSYPEEKTTVTEEFFVTQAGTFSAPVVSIESLYAPHYRANDGFTGELVSR